MEAFLYTSLDKDLKVKCNLCNHRCIISNKKLGICKVRVNNNGILESLVYDKIIATSIDPIEKKPLFHLYPGSLSYSIATVGCNFKCRFCQNSNIAQMPADNNGLIMGDKIDPEDIVKDAQKNNCKSIAYTYTEPTIYFEFAYNTAKIAKKNGIFNVFVSNGYMTCQAINMISPYLDAANIDLKAFNQKFYKNYCNADINHVKETLILMKKLNIFVEITTLIIPDLNDDIKELTNLAEFISKDLGDDTPWHISRFHPTYKLTNHPPTPLSTLLTAREIGIKSGLKYVYTGNVHGEEGENTICYNCGKTIIKRWGFRIVENLIKNGKCSNCNSKIHGIGL